MCVYDPALPIDGPPSWVEFSRRGFSSTRFVGVILYSDPASRSPNLISNQNFSIATFPSTISRCREHVFAGRVDM